MRRAAEKKVFRVFEVSLVLLLAALTGAVLSAPSLTEADVWILNGVLALRSPALFDFFSLLTTLGSPTAVLSISTLACVTLLLQRKFVYAVGFFVAVGGASISEWLMKIIVERARPSGFSELLPHSYSFPSGHAAAAMALYGFLAYLLCIFFPRWRAAIIVLGFCIIAGVGFSRIYIGVHYPSDVLGGYLLATLWIFMGAKIVHLLQKNSK